MTNRDAAIPTGSPTPIAARRGGGGVRAAGAAPRPESGDQRRARVLARLHDVGVLSVADLARELGVSHMTVRRDLQRLEAAGQVRTVHGGVGLAGGDRVRRGAGCDEAAARRLARRAAELVAPGDTVALDAGPEAYELARVLADGVAGTVITHSMPVMQLLAERNGGGTGPRLVALGGELTHARQALVGPTTLDAIAGLRARVFFLDAAAVDARGTYACSTPEARVARGLAGIADRVVLLVSRRAVRGSAPALVAGLEQLDVAVVDEPPSPSLAAAFARAGVTVHMTQA
jgi:DeoR/GlpR family transcriptional regulator of sugar metabolism